MTTNSTPQREAQWMSCLKEVPRLKDSVSKISQVSKLVTQFFLEIPKFIFLESIGIKFESNLCFVSIHMSKIPIGHFRNIKEWFVHGRQWCISIIIILEVNQYWFMVSFSFRCPQLKIFLSTCVLSIRTIIYGI